MKINLTNIQESRYYMKEAFRNYLIENNLSVFVDEINEQAVIYDKEGNDIDRMTLNQLARRVKLS